MRKLQHRLAHLMRINMVRPEFFWNDGHLWLRFICSRCGQRGDFHNVDHFLREG